MFMGGGVMAVGHFVSVSLLLLLHFRSGWLRPAPYRHLSRLYKSPAEQDGSLSPSWLAGASGAFSMVLGPGLWVLGSVCFFDHLHPSTTHLTTDY